MVISGERPRTQEASCSILNLNSIIANLVASQNDCADIKHQLVAYLNGCNKQLISQVIPGVKGFENNFLILL